MKFTALLLCGAIASSNAMDISDNQEKLYELMQLNTAECRDIVKVRGLAKGDPLKTKCEGFYEINGGWLDPNSDDYKRRQGGGHSAFSDDDRHFAVRGRICYCLAKRKVRRDLVDCVREGWH